MRILYSHRIQSHDGQGRHVEEMVRALREMGHEVRVVGPAFYQSDQLGSESRMVGLLRRLLVGPLRELAELAYNLPAYRRLSRACQEFRPELIYERANLYHFAGLWAARRQAVPLFVEVNSPLAEERARFSRLYLQHLAVNAEHAVWRRADHVFAVTGVLKSVIAQAGVPAARITVTQNGIDPRKFTSTAVRPERDHLRLGFIGFVRDWHGLDQVIDGMAVTAARSGRTMFLDVVGDGPARPALEQLVQRLGLGALVRFHGLVAADRIPDMVGQFDIALQPRAVAYASPLKIFEYMAAGCAIVAPDQPNIREILTHRTTALLFDPNEPAAMWQAIDALASDEALRRQLGQAAREEIIARDYTWAGNARRVTAEAAR